MSKLEIAVGSLLPPARCGRYLHDAQMYVEHQAASGADQRTSA